jgi:8-oxoguanine deaminase
LVVHDQAAACALSSPGRLVPGLVPIELRAAFLIRRNRYGVSAVRHRDALRWATKGSAACIGRPELGEIRAGEIADFALFKLDELRFSGVGDSLAALVLCGAHKADRVMIGGAWVVERASIGRLERMGGHQLTPAKNEYALA